MFLDFFPNTDDMGPTVFAIFGGLSKVFALPILESTFPEPC